MGQKINVLIISILAVVISVVSFVFAINYRKESINYFYDSGYIISNLYKEGSDNVNKLYFDNKTTYKQSDNNTYTFTNSEGERVNVSEESFVHYSNGSIMSLKKGVAIDLNDIDSKLISYYNIFEGSVLTKKNEVYEIENLNEVVTFSRLMFKISGNKYLIGASKIVISFADDQTVDMEDYAEIEYVNENVIRIYNDEVNYQTIASDLYLIIDDIKIDLEYKTISKNSIEYLTMADMVINSDDNIEVLPEKEIPIVPEDTNNNGGNGNDGNNQGNGNGGEIDPDLQEGLENLIPNLPEDGEQVEEEKEVIQPKFKVDSMDVTTLGFENLSLSFEDESSVLYGSRIVEILENSTGKIVATLDEWDEGSLNYTVNSYFSLKPNTAYTLNVIGQYKIEDTIYDRTFVSKIFRTLDIGLDIVDDYKTYDSLSFAIYRNSYSEVNGFKYNIVDKAGNVIVEDTSATFDGNERVIITETEKFTSNTEYILTIKDIQYGNDIFTTVSYQELQLTYNTKTLKVNPFKVSEAILKGTVDSGKNIVTFTVDGINDINGGIVSYTYNIYKNDAISNEGNVDFNNEIIKTVNKNDSNPLILSFEDLGTEVGEVGNVYFNVSINFDDNEKTIVYVSSNSQPITLTGTPYPTVVDYLKSEDNKNSEILSGEILIDDAYNFMKINNISYYKIDIKENVSSTLGGTEQLVGTVQIETPNEGTSRYALPVYFEGLKPDSEYILYVYLLHNGKYIYLGYDIASTETPEPIYLNIDYPEDENDKNTMFDFEVSRNLERESISFNNLKYLNFELYRSSSSNTSENKKWEKIDFAATVPENQDSQDLYNLVYENKKISVDASDFGFYAANYENIYNYKIVVTGFAQGYEIPVKINDYDTNEFSIKFNNIAPSLSIVGKQKVLNSESGQIDNTLAGDTIVGINFEIQTNENPTGQIVNKVSYSIFEAESYDEANDTCIPKNDGEQSSAIVAKDSLILSAKNQKEFVPFVSSNTNGLHRGVHYCMVYSGTYEADGEEFNVSTNTLHFMSEKQHVEITGYIKEYDGTDIVFKLNIEDPDSSLIKSSTDESLPNIKLRKLSSEEEVFVESVSDNGEYTFKGLNDNIYLLNIVENVGNGEVTRSIYETRLDNIINTNNINVIVDTRSSGKITLKIPYGTCDMSIEPNCITNGLDETIVSRISGLGILSSNDNNIHVFDLQRADEYLYTEINLSNIEQYGKINGNELTFNTVSILYDSGKIVDYNNDTNSFFIKLKNTELDTNYFDKSTDKFNYISKNSIFNKNNLSYDTSYDYYNIDSTNSTLKFNVFNPLIENSSIGILLSKTGNVSRLIHFNEVATTESYLYDTDYNKTNKFTVLNVLSTSGIKTVYTSTGADVSFDIINSSIVDGTELIVELSNGENAIVTCTLDGENCNWSNYSSDNKIRKISVNSDNQVTISFDNINDAEYKYSVKFETPDAESSAYTYNTENKNNNDNIVITSLKELYLNSYSSDLNKIYWNWTNENEKTDLQFIKQIRYLFDVDINKYDLNSDEKLVYKILAKNKTDDSKSKYIVGDNDSYVELLDSNSGVINLYEKTLDAGTYEIILQPVLEISNNNSKELVALQDFVLNSELVITTVLPTFNVVKSADPIFKFTMNDEDGMLTACPAPETGDTIGYANADSKNYYENNSIVNKEVVYFELYQKNGDTETFMGFSPVPFISKSSILDLTNYFNNKNLPTGNYTVKVSYCVNNIEGVQRVAFGPFHIYNVSSLNMQLITMTDSFILMLANPDEATKDSIKRIKYQYTTANGSVVKELNNLDNDINNTNNIVYTTSVVSKDVTNYFLGISVDGTLTSKITSLRIDFYSGATDDTLITTYSR